MQIGFSIKLSSCIGEFLELPNYVNASFEFWPVCLAYDICSIHIVFQMESCHMSNLKYFEPIYSTYMLVCLTY